MGFEQYNLGAEDAQKMLEEMQAKKTLDHDLNRITATPESYEVQELLQSYQTTIKDFHAQLLELEKYIGAKEEINAIIRDVDRAMLGYTPSSVEIAEKLSQIEKYKKIIAWFEGEGAPKDLLERAKDTRESLSEKLVTLSKIVEVANDEEKLKLN